MNEDLRRIYQGLEHITEEIESTILLASNVFNRIEQGVYAHTELDPEPLTADECRAREPESTILINRLQEHRKGIEHIMRMYEVTVCEVKNCNHPTLLSRLERDIKWKIRDLFNKVLYKEFLVYCYQIKLEFRQKTNFARHEVLCCVS
ncbi:hypothetical protein CDAR_264731 [Caerostris darwini]|uniref:Uncharacterized protein n=1 Tax=Caerostris darwini TaxID=1538125 RepID=A0AAV4NKN2_9ARAC|nr:hypothetical protein CDAR_264731 [Caerostris darwini]